MTGAGGKFPVYLRSAPAKKRPGRVTVLASSDKKPALSNLTRPAKRAIMKTERTLSRDGQPSRQDQTKLTARVASGRSTRFWGKVYRDREDHDDTYQHSQDSRPTSATHPLSPPFTREWLTAYVPRQRPPLSGPFHPSTGVVSCQFPPPRNGRRFFYIRYKKNHSPGEWFKKDYTNNLTLPPALRATSLREGGVFPRKVTSLRGLPPSATGGISHTTICQIVPAQK